MNILQAMVKLRNDIIAWVTNNILALKELVDKNRDDVATINGSDSVSGSISNKIKTALTNYNTKTEISSTYATKTEMGNKADKTHTHSDYVNQNAFSSIKAGGVTVTADKASDLLELVAGENITISGDSNNDQIRITATDTKYTHPSYTARASGFNKVTVDNTGHVSTVTAVTKEDITKLGIPTQDTTYSTGTTSYSGITKLYDSTGTSTDGSMTRKAITSALGEKADNEHGNHVPQKQTADSSIFLRNDNTWQKVTPANIGAAAEEHGTHVTYATAAPKAAGTAAVGTSAKVAREDHVHAAQANVTGNAGTATKLQVARNITIGDETRAFDGTENIAFSISNIGAAPAVHDHGDLYYTKKEIDDLLASIMTNSDIDTSFKNAGF
jgi:hypothetical protein